jgi:hypothetical protein
MSRIHIFQTILVFLVITVLYSTFDPQTAYSQCNVLCMHERGTPGPGIDNSSLKIEPGLSLEPSYEVAINDSSYTDEEQKNNSLLLAENGTGTDTANIQPSPDRWHFVIIPYLWASAMTGKVGIGPLTANVNESFSDTLSNLDFGLQLHMEASKDRYGFYLDGNYSKMSSGSAHTLPGQEQNTINANNTAWFYLGELGGFYRVGKWCLSNTTAKSTLKLDLLGGGRFWYLKDEIDFKGPAGVNPNVGKSKSWLDLFVGGRARMDIDKFFILIESDVGGFDLGFSSTITWNIEGYIGYELPWWGITPIIGYRALYDNYDSGSGKSYFRWDGWLYGPVIGLGVQF